MLDIERYRDLVGEKYGLTRVISSLPYLSASFIALLTLAIVINVASRSFGRRKIPPGPRSPGFFGAVSSVDSSLPPWKKFELLHKLYGPVVSFYQRDTLVVVLGTIKAATDLLEKKGSIYSSRPRKIMAGQILSGDMRGLGMPYGIRWRNWRSLMHAGMGVEASAKYKSFQAIESAIMLSDLLAEENSTRYSSHFRRFAISIVICVAYGKRIISLDDPLVTANQKTDECYISTQYAVEIWPILLKLPKSLQWFRYEAEEQRQRDTKLYLSLMNDVRSQMDLGLAQPSVAKYGLEKQKDFGLSDEELAFALSAPFAAGVGTTLSVIDVFFLAMLTYPETMKKAQAEIDAIVGSDHLPGFDDAESLPYMCALIKETLRWRPIAPTGVPHSVIADDVYEDDMYIPKGSTVFANIHSMSKDEEMFPSPDLFKPERYLDSGGEGPVPHTTFFFGFGRRVCPGMHIAHNSLFIAISRILWAFNVVPKVDGAGTPILPSTKNFIGGLVIRPQPFDYLLQFRRDVACHHLIQEDRKKAELEASAWM